MGAMHAALGYCGATPLSGLLIFSLIEKPLEFTWLIVLA